MKKDLNEEDKNLNEGFMDFLENTCNSYIRHKNQGTIIEVSMRNYRWAKDRWPGRTVHVTTYEGENTLTVLRPGFSMNSKCRRRIVIDDETLQRERKRTTLSATYSRLIPKRGS